MTKKKQPRCPYTQCGRVLPGPYGVAGVSMSRQDNRTLVCSSCGTGEALVPRGTFNGQGQFDPEIKIPLIMGLNTWTEVVNTLEQK